MITKFSSDSKITKSDSFPSPPSSSSQIRSSTSKQERDPHLYKYRYSSSSSSSFEYGNYTFHLYPDFTRSIVETIKYYKWPSIIFLYNTDTGM